MSQKEFNERQSDRQESRLINIGHLLRESFPRQVDKKSRGPQGEGSGGRKDKLFSFSTFLRII